MNLAHIIVETSKKFPYRNAISFDSQTIDYSNLNLKIDSLASFLLTAGCEKGDNILLYINKSIDAVIALFAVLKIGAVYVPIDINTPNERFRFIMQNAKIKTIITNYEGLKREPVTHCEWARIISLGNANKQNGTQIACLQFDLENCQETAQPVNIDVAMEDPAYILYTSGSTGLPKGVIHTHGSAMSFIDWSSKYFNISENDIFTSHAPFYFDLSIFDVFVSLYVGGKLCLLPKSITSFPKSLSKFIYENKITVWYSVPTPLIGILTMKKFDSVLLQSLKTVIYAGESFPVKHLRKFVTLIDANFYNLYGPTETNVITYYQIDKERIFCQEEIPIGYPCPYSTIKIVDENMNEVNIGDKGELIVRTDSLMLNYVGNQSQTKNFLRRNKKDTGSHVYYATGDIVKVIDRDFFQFVCRKDHMVKVNGYRIELEEIESVISRHYGVKQCVVCAVSMSGNRALKAYVIANDDITTSDIYAHLKCYLPTYMMPTEIVFCDKLKTNNNGKIDRAFFENT